MYPKKRIKQITSHHSRRTCVHVFEVEAGRNREMLPRKKFYLFERKIGNSPPTLFGMYSTTGISKCDSSACGVIQASLSSEADF